METAKEFTIVAYSQSSQGIHRRLFFAENKPVTVKAVIKQEIVRQDNVELPLIRVYCKDWFEPGILIGLDTGLGGSVVVLKVLGLGGGNLETSLYTTELTKEGKERGVPLSYSQPIELQQIISKVFRDNLNDFRGR